MSFTTPTVYQKCTKCGSRNNLSNTVCEVCGASLEKQQSSSTKSANNQVSKKKTTARNKFSLPIHSLNNLTKSFKYSYLLGGTVLGIVVYLIPSVLFNTILSPNEQLSENSNNPNIAKKDSQRLLRRTTTEPALTVGQDYEIEYDLTTLKEVKVPEGIFKYSGSNCFAALTREGFHEAIKTAHPEYQLKYEESDAVGCAADVTPLLEQEIAFLHQAQVLSDRDYRRAREEGFRLESNIVAYDGVVPYTAASTDLNLNFLTIDQLKSIYRGEITNWQEVGGSSLPISIIGLNPKIDSDIKLLMGREEATAKIKVVANYTAAMRKVSETPGAISLSSAAILKQQETIRAIAVSTNGSNLPITAILADGSINLEAFNVKTYPLLRVLSVVNLQNQNNQDIRWQAAIAYINLLLSEEGQTYLACAGFFPVQQKFSSDINKDCYKAD